MKILAIETTGKYAGVCIGLKDDIVYCKTEENEMEHLSCLLPMAKDLLAENNLKIEDIEAVAVSVGPGSFTGMRIGIAFARGIAQARGIKCIAVNTLEAFCLSENAVEGKAEFCIPMIDARRGQVYASLYKLIPGEEEIPSEEIKTDVYMLKDFLQIVKNYILEKKVKNGIRLFFTGNGSIKYREELNDFNKNLKEEHEIETVLVFEKPEKVEQNAYNILKLAKLFYGKNQFTEYARLAPAYLRKAEAERKLKKIKQEELEKASDIISI